MYTVQYGRLAKLSHRREKTEIIKGDSVRGVRGARGPLIVPQGPMSPANQTIIPFIHNIRTNNKNNNFRAQLLEAMIIINNHPIYS